jgi:hypothetical protein
MAVTTGSGVAAFNFSLKQGSDTSISVIWWDDNGQPMDLTDYSMLLQIRAFQSSPIVLLSLSSANDAGSYIALSGQAGTIDLIFAHADTAALMTNGQPSFTPMQQGLRVGQVGFYDLQFTDPTGDIGYLFEGTVSLDPWVTQ